MSQDGEPGVFAEPIGWAQAVNPRDPERLSRERRLVGQLLRLGLVVSAMFALAFAAVHFTAARTMPFATPGALAAAALTLVYLLLTLGHRKLSVPTVYVLCTVATTGAAFAVAVLSRQGVASVALTFGPVMIFAAGTRLGGSTTAVLGAGHAVGLAALLASQWALPGWWGGPPLVEDWLPALVTHASVLAAALGFGRVMRRSIAGNKVAAQQREQRLAALFSVAADSFFEMDRHLRFTMVSSKGQAEGSTHPWVGKTPWEVPDLSFDPNTLDAYRADLESRQPFANFVSSMRLPDGSVRWSATSGRPRFDDRGVFLGYWGVGRDITAEREAERARVMSEARYRQLFERSPSPLVVHREGAVIEANAAVASLLGLGEEAQMIGRNLTDFYDDEDGSRERARQRIAQLGLLPVGRTMPTAAFVLRTVHGRRLLVQVTSVKIDALGGPAVLSMFVDETDRRRAESARERTEALLAHVVTSSPDSMMLVDVLTGRCVLVNDALLTLTGHSRDRTIGRTIAELDLWPELAQWHRFLQELTRGGRVMDHAAMLRTREGRLLSVMLWGMRFVMEGRDYVVLNARDVTASERSRLEYAAVLENASIGIAMTRQRVFVMANPRFEQMFGWAHGELVGQPGYAVSGSATDYDDLVVRIAAQLERGEPVEFERTMRRKDGSTFLCRFMARAVERHRPGEGATIWIAEDVTERRAVENALARARDEAEAANRAKSAFLANTSHEIRTPLNGMVGLARLARQAGLDEHRRARYLEQIDESAKALAGVISDILDLSKIEAGRLTLEAVPFDLHALLESIEHGYQALAEARALSLRMVVAPDVPRRVIGDPVRVRQVLTNFLNNALKFTDRGGVRLGVKAVGSDRLRLEVQDTGPGIAPAVKARLFQPFSQADVSTTRRFGGTGLGLSICAELAKLMGGEVGVDSESGRGSLFWAELPLPASQEAALQSAFGDLTAEGHPLTGMHVLVVEDNPVNMMIAVALLEQWGVQVSQATDGVQAVDRVSAVADEGGMFDLVLMDLQMPVRGGQEATRMIRERFDARTLPIVALTAAALTSERDAALEAGMNDFLTKPIDAQRLHDALLRWRQPSPTMAALLDELPPRSG